MKGETCCFTGHRNIPAEIRHELFSLTETVVENAIKNGYRYFGIGGVFVTTIIYLNKSKIEKFTIYKD